MGQFRKKPVVIEATQWFQKGDHSNVKAVYIPFDLDPPKCPKCGKPARAHGTIITLEGKNGAQEVCPGDWIITGVQGENYPCKPDIFAATYESATICEALPRTYEQGAEDMRERAAVKLVRRAEYGNTLMRTELLMMADEVRALPTTPKEDK